MYTTWIKQIERYLTVNKTTGRKPEPQSAEKEALTLTLYSLIGVVVILIAIYFMTL
mgnify:CR=1 FL=1|jgi:hypothetical protein